MVRYFELNDGTTARFGIRKKDISRSGGTELHYRYTVEIKARHNAITVPYHDYSTAFYYHGVLNKKGARKCILKTLGQPVVKNVLTKDDMMCIKATLAEEAENEL